jgi:hypothetical protein
VKISRLKIDKNKANSGTWCQTGLDGLELLVARQGNIRYRDYIAKNSKELQIQARHNTIDVKTVDKINKDAASQFILLGWRNLTNDDGTDIPYSPEKARELFDLAPDLYEITMSFAQDMNQFLADAAEDAKGNSDAA